MPATRTRPALERLVLEAKTAAELMTPDPVSLDQDATVQEAVAFLTERAISAAPVIDDAGRPVGVLSRADIVWHDRENARRPRPAPDFYHNAEIIGRGGEMVPPGFQVEFADRTRVKDIMTPTVIAVAPGDSTMTVVRQMLALKIHRLFVVDDGVLTGVISVLDILRHLRREEL
jgi:CBS domain-containing protein